MSEVRSIAFYFPQFHPIPENDAWWGKGFTDWNNVRAARPRFPGHHQPHVPTELGYYDLRSDQTRLRQANLAREYGVSGFCYYHYWFDGRRLLGDPLDSVLSTGQPDFPFCLCWANENWTRVWDGRAHEVLMGQHYSPDDDRRHMAWLCGVFQDTRYIRVDGRPLFLVYRASQLPDPAATVRRWREEARRLGAGELFLCRVESIAIERGDPRDLGFDASVEFAPHSVLMARDLRDRAWARVPAWTGLGQRRRAGLVVDYDWVVDRALASPTPSYPRFPGVTPGWDNTPRRKRRAVVLHGSSPEGFLKWVSGALDRLTTEPRVLFVNAWNEWAEGNHLEPCARWDRAYLEAHRSALKGHLDVSRSTNP